MVEHKKWEVYLSIARKIETQGKGTDNGRGFEVFKPLVYLFKSFLPPPARILNPGGIDEAALLSKEGYEVHSLVLGEDNVKILKEKYPDVNVNIREHDMHDLDYPKDYFDGVFMNHTYEHCLSWYIFLGELYYVCRNDAIALTSMPGIVNPEMFTIWHINLQPPKLYIKQWEYWGWKLKYWNENEESPTMVFQKLPPNHPEFKNWSYLQWVYKLRDGEKINYVYHCSKCGL